MPFGEFFLEEIFYLLGSYFVLPKQVELLACLNLKAAQVIFVCIVFVNLVLTEGSIAVSFPASAEIDFVVDTADTIPSAYHQAKGIVFSVTCVRYLQLLQYWCKESAWSTQTIDAQSIVAAVVFCPFTMVDKTWWKRVQLEVTHAIRTNHHCSTFGIEGIYHSLQGLWRRVQVVAVKLHHKASHLRVMYCHIPASTDAEVVTFGNDVYDTFVVPEFVDGFRCSIGASIIYDDEVERE